MSITIQEFVSYDFRCQNGHFSDGTGCFEPGSTPKCDRGHPYELTPSGIPFATPTVCPGVDCPTPAQTGLRRPYRRPPSNWKAARDCEANENWYRTRIP